MYNITDYIVVPSYIDSKEIVSIETSKMVEHYMKAIIDFNVKHSFISKEIAVLEEGIESSKESREIELTKLRLLKSKNKELEFQKKLAVQKVYRLTGKISEEDYQFQRDAHLCMLIVQRANTKRVMDYLYVICRREGITLDKEYFDKLDIVLHGYQNYSVKDLMDKEISSKEEFSLLERTLREKKSILPDFEDVKEAMASYTTIPTYVDNTLHGQKNDEVKAHKF